MRWLVLLLARLWPLGLSSCKAETLGVSIPEGGPGAISQEDIQRDLWLLDQLGRRVGGPGGAEARGRIERRLQDMRTRPGFVQTYQRPGPNESGVVCGEKDGVGREPVLVVARDPGIGPGGAAAVAALISIAKGFDTPQLPPSPLLLCAWIGAEAEAVFRARPPQPLPGMRAVVFIDPLGGELAFAEGTWEGRPSLTAAGSAPPQAMAELDFRAVQAQVVALHGRISALMAPEE